jgi:hypothetical protein
LLFRELHQETFGRLSQQLFVDAIIATPIVAAALIWSGRLGAQLLARGAWWSMLLIGAIMAMEGSNSERAYGAYIALANATALLVAGGTGLADNRGRFAPMAFRGTLIVALVLAIADTGAFACFGLGTALFSDHASVILLVPFMLTGVIGLLRLRTWGLIVSLCTNLLIAILALTRTLPLPTELRWLFVGTAMLQLLVPIPMIVAIIRGTPPRPDAWRRTKIAVPAMMISAIALLSIYAAFVHDGRLLRL